ncbi:transposase DDE domain protein [Clostridium homopropionicum DSM 5847]|uniref:Transposase DDE domain protein n=1 Tax=Clostridium homopropionicum DSM 5847 TaxID=1121318 RepID=A0A0L6Z972_9CLOT|nr:transposase [Clostridium homopropionicum]KOA19328.1 transposase DDE domain protein [Clostridium homopropionicum DSM 5847]SFG21322.1 Transposase DDE domain-containing protein [Clostridium homopropionicum]
MFCYLTQKAQKKFGAVKLKKELPPLKIIDSTVILLELKVAPHLKMDSERSGIKISTLYNGKYPEKINIVKGNVNDRKCIDSMFEDKSSIYIFDRGYYSYKLYDKLTKDRIKFITRGVTNAVIMEERVINAYPQKDIYFITNIFDLSTEDIINIYKKRWEIELFFKWIKENLRIKRFIGYNENAIKIQIFAALISYLLIYINGKMLNVKFSMLTLTRIIRSNLLEFFSEDFKEVIRAG